MGDLLEDWPRGEAAVQSTRTPTGQALLFTSIVLALAFAIYVFSTLGNLVSFGVLAAFEICMAFLADILLAPALIQVRARYSSIRVEVKAQ